MNTPTLHPAVRLALLYAVLAGAWIILSDRVLAALTSDPLLLTRLQTANGWDVAAAVKARVPTCPVVLLTGWADQHTDETAGPGVVDRVLHKPVRLQELLEVIAELTPVRTAGGDPARDSAGPPGRD